MRVVLLSLRFPRWLAFTLPGLFALQYVLPGQAARYLLCAVYGGIAVAALARNRRYILPTLLTPFRRFPPQQAGPAPRQAGQGPGELAGQGPGELAGARR